MDDLKKATILFLISFIILAVQVHWTCIIFQNYTDANKKIQKFHNSIMTTELGTSIV